MPSDRLAAQQVSLQDVVAGVSGANENAAGGVIVTPDQELIVRGIGRATSVADLAVALVAHRNGQPIRVQDVATVTKGPALARGDGSVNGQRAIMLILTSISKRGKTIFPWVLLPLLLILKRQRAIGSLYR